MNRREILKYTAIATGVALSAPLITSLSACKGETVAKKPIYKPIYFNEGEFSFINQFVDIILPKTDTPSASDVGVQNIIDTMLGTIYKEKEQAEYKTAFDALYQHLHGVEGAEKDFKGLTPEVKLEQIKAIANSEDETMKAAKDAYFNLKQQTIAYYLTTEEIGTKYLNYLPVPGAYEPCIKLEEVGGKAWAL